MTLNTEVNKGMLSMSKNEATEQLKPAASLEEAASNVQKETDPTNDSLNPLAKIISRP